LFSFVELYLIKLDPLLRKTLAVNPEQPSSVSVVDPAPQAIIVMSAVPRTLEDALRPLANGTGLRRVSETMKGIGSLETTERSLPNDINENL
jgi:hypothetical protein